jgi:hypothetical protein
MVKYSSRNNGSSLGQWILVCVFAFSSLVFLVMPLFRNPVQDLWRWVSLSVASIQADGIEKIEGASSCVVISVPPYESFDTILLECSPDSHMTLDDFVWYVDGEDSYLVGKVTGVRGSRVVASMFSTGAAKHPLDVRFVGFPERYSAFPLGGGSLRVEIPVEVEVVAGEKVRHAVSNHLFGVVSAVHIEKGSYIKRVYIRLPFSFEKLVRLEVR